MIEVDLRRPGRPTQPHFDRLRRACLCYDPAELVRPDFGGRNGTARPGFETVEACVEEDHLRAQLLAALPCAEARHLSERLLDTDVDFAHPTLASRRGQRECRRVVVNNLMEKMEGHADRELCTFTMVKPEWGTAAADLPTLDPSGLVGAVRRDMPRREDMLAASWLWAQVHGEYDSRTNRFQLHLHGVCTTDYKPHLQALAKHCDRGLVRQPLRFEQVRQPDRARQVSYLMQSFWPYRPTFVRDGVIHRTRRKCRIPEPMGSLGV